MAELFAKAGLACRIAAIIGGGLKAFSIEFPLLRSGFSEVVLAITGTALMTVGWTDADEDLLLSAAELRLARAGRGRASGSPTTPTATCWTAPIATWRTA